MDYSADAAYRRSLEMIDEPEPDEPDPDAIRDRWLDSLIDEYGGEVD